MSSATRATKYLEFSSNNVKRVDGSSKRTTPNDNTIEVRVNSPAIPQVSKNDAWQMLQDDDRAILVDVRTPTEWRTIGVPSTSGLGREVRLVSWVFEGGVPNAEFVPLTTDGLDPDTPILLLCRSGQRSNLAAAALYASGYTGVNNVVEGFEGPLQPDGSHSGGWKDTLPTGDYDE